jgi:histidinol-phosphate aminotransferase
MNTKLDWLEVKLRNMQSIKEYSPKYSPETVAKQLGIDVTEIIRLDKNENLFLSKQFFSKIIKELAEELDPRFYPQKEKSTLIQNLVKYLDLPSESIILGNGSDELIETIVRVFLGSNSTAISITPTFIMYRIIVNNHGNTIIDTFLNDDFSLNVASLLSKASHKTRLCFICSPNNPTGNQFKIESVKEVLKKFRGIVIIDEAYVEYAPYSVGKLIKEYENLIVLRTFSKAFGLAGLRIGYCLTHPNLASALKKIQLPFNINKFSLQLAIKLLDKRNIVKTSVNKLKIERERFYNKLCEIPGVKAFASNTNFLLFTTEKDVDIIYNTLMRHGILIRNIGNILHFGRCLRVTVGLPKMNNKFLNIMKELCCS